jgi:hypothetical protein
VQRYRVLKQVSLAYAILMAGMWLTEKTQALTQGGGSKEIMDNLPEIHSSAAGLKALSTVM